MGANSYRHGVVSSTAWQLPPGAVHTCKGVRCGTITTTTTHRSADGREIGGAGVALQVQRGLANLAVATLEAVASHHHDATVVLERCGARLVVGRHLPCARAGAAAINAALAIHLAQRCRGEALDRVEGRVPANVEVERPRVAGLSTRNETSCTTSEHGSKIKMVMTHSLPSRWPC